jgi:hypothetical protein
MKRSTVSDGACGAAPALLLAALLAAPLGAQEKQPPAVDQTKSTAAIQKGAAWLRERLKEGLPPINQQNDPHHDGSTYNEIVMYAMLYAGVPSTDPDLVKLLNDIRLRAPVHTYTGAIRAQALEKYDPVKLYEDIRQCGQFLLDNQGKEGYWGYSKEVPLPPLPKLTLTPDSSKVASGPAGGTIKSTGSGTSTRATTAIRKTLLTRRDWGEKNDNSNTQYAMLGFAACMTAGIYPPADCFPLVEKWLTECQNDDGGWGYEHRNTPMHGGEASYGSMTAGAISSLSIILRFHHNKEPIKDVRIQKGLQWLGKNLTFDQNPAKGGWHYYWIYSVERAGSFAGTQWFGDRPWYYEGATYLLDKQDGDGAWGEGNTGDKILNTCWAILFLKQASKHYVFSLDTHKR